MTIYSLGVFFFPNLEPVCCSISGSNCSFLTCIQVSQEAGKAVCYCHLLKNFPQFVVIHTVKGFGIINKAEVDVFLDTPIMSYTDQCGEILTPEWWHWNPASSKDLSSKWTHLDKILLPISLSRLQRYRWQWRHIWGGRWKGSVNCTLERAQRESGCDCSKGEHAKSITKVGKEMRGS